MSGYTFINNNSSPYIRCIFDVLKKSINKVKEVIFNLEMKKNKLDSSFYNENIKIINKYMIDISEDLEKMECFDNEYYDFFDIRNMFNYIFSDVNLCKENISFFKETFRRFKDLIFNKIEIESGRNLEVDYVEEYDLFKEFLNKQKSIFFTEIFKSSSEYDELIVEVTNILG